jgi:hypothetical protein
LPDFAFAGAFAFVVALRAPTVALRTRAAGGLLLASDAFLVLAPSDAFLVLPPNFSSDAFLVLR